LEKNAGFFSCVKNTSVSSYWQLQLFSHSDHICITCAVLVMIRRCQEFTDYIKTFRDELPAHLDVVIVSIVKFYPRYDTYG